MITSTRVLCQAAEEEDDHMVTCEREAAEALAALACCSNASVSAELHCSSQQGAMFPSAPHTSQDQAIAVQECWGNTNNMVRSALRAEETVRIVECTTKSYQSNSANRSRQNLTEAEREARRLRRILANRESARQTIRRRQAMHLELIKQAADLSEENKNLKKEKELAVKEYTSLKGRNEFLKLQLANIKKAEQREMQEAPNPSAEEIPSSATTGAPILLYYQPSISPFLWPSIFASSNGCHLQCASRSDIISSAMHRIDMPSLNQGQELYTKLGHPLFVLAVPWLLPFLSGSNTIHSHCDTNKRQNETSSTRQCSFSSSSDSLFVKDEHQLISNLNMMMEASSSARAMPVENVCAAGFTSLADETCNFTAVSAPGHTSRGLAKKNQEPIIRRNEDPENVFAATTARRKRKELMKLKNNRSQLVHIHSKNLSVSG
ncbi:uncharacterized protein LOC105161771 isoform X1 [Sesamum indicum]|uniref:Uncharacterized protein LOC105161771 isoform X1 n=2 Tax=Sesamum indicum TaxID=4182 RepID=A0A6I9T6W3_SESIN|nr:uncharacterized protein LOC105161771 isoform X1 [Sesamum indicum]